jgi:hypothetical protein
MPGAFRAPILIGKVACERPGRAPITAGR